MKEAIVQVYSGIHSQLKHRVLWRGSLLAGIGLSIWLWAGIFFTQEVLEIWGLPVFFLGAGLLYVGTRPYRQLMQVESLPHRFTLTDGQNLELALHGKLLFSFPLDAVQSSAYREDEDIYGIRLWLKEDAWSSVSIHNPRVEWQRYHERVSRRHGCDIFLPYFGKSAYKRLCRLCLPVGHRPENGNNKSGKK